MFFRNISYKVAPRVRCIHTTSAVRGDHDTRGVFGSNLPFNVQSRIGLLFWTSLFFGSGIAVPFLATRKMILAKNG